MLSNEMSQVWIVIAAFNEETVIAKTISDIRAYFSNVIVCDDCSSDLTADQAYAAGAHVLTHPINLGQGAALQTGITYALSQGADLIVTFDADGQHNEKEIGPMINALRTNGADVALGSRFLNKHSNIPRSRKLILNTALLFTKLTTKIQLTDVHNGFRVLTRDFCKGFEFKQNRMAHASEILEYIATRNVKFIEHPVTINYTEYSLSKGQRSSNAIRILMELLMQRISK